MTGSIIKKIVVLALCALVVLLVASAVQGQDSKKDKVKLTGAQIKQMISEYYVTAGVNKRTGYTYMVINFEDGDRMMFYYSSRMGPGNTKGTCRVVDNKMCTKWEQWGDLEWCSELYRIGEDKYESWSEVGPGKFEFAGTFFRLQ